jgi:UDP-N-acetylglucosamine--N-acetylmuramyl-(pentapeptide) pyrophosphoryl-undecaprenol N-acetylglucosamine transferase
MAGAGAATVVENDDLTPERLAEEVSGLLSDSERLEAMSAASRSLAMPDAAQRIAEEVLSACTG